MIEMNADQLASELMRSRFFIFIFALASDPKKKSGWDS
jgi:hypothetical protein